MSLIDQIRMAQRNAGEAAVMADLKRKGLLIDEPKEPPEADKLLQQALDFVAFEKDGSTQSVEAFINSRDSLITAIRTYLENKT